MVREPNPANGAYEGVDSSFVRGLRVLTSIADNGSIRAQDLAAELELPLSTVYRYLRTLREFALIEEQGGHYVAGWRLSELSRHDTSRTRLLELGHQTLRQITSRTGETSVLTVRTETSAVCLRQVESSHTERSSFRLDQLLPLYAGTGQRVLLAYAPQSLIDLVLAERVRPLTARTLTSEVLESELVRIRRDGWAVSRGGAHQELIGGGGACVCERSRDRLLACHSGSRKPLWCRVGH